MTTYQIFLKVWEVEETNVHSVELESMHHRMTFEAGVPVATQVFHDIANSRNSCGIEFLDFAVEYFHQDSIEDPQDFLLFCRALVDAVMVLHEQANSSTATSNLRI